MLSHGILDLEMFKSLVGKVGFPRAWIIVVPLYSINSADLAEYVVPRNIFLRLNAKHSELSIVFTKYLLHVAHPNQTLFYDYESFKRKFGKSFVERISPRLSADESFEGPTAAVRKPFQLTMTCLETFSFLSCYSKPYLNFKFYAWPFESNLWDSLFLMMAILTLIASRYFHDFGRKEQRFSTVLYLLRSLLENGPALSKTVEKHSGSKIVAGCWLILTVVTTNGYKGKITNWVVAPLPRTPLLNSIMDLNTTTQFADGRAYAHLDAHTVKIWRNTKAFSQIIPQIKLRRLNIVQKRMTGRYALFHYNSILNIYDEAVITKYLPPLEILNKLPYYVAPKLKAFMNSYDAAIESEIVKCKEKTVLIDTALGIKGELNYLNQLYPSIEFYQKETSTEIRQVSWMFDNPLGSNVPFVFARLTESGIYEQFKSIHNNMHYSKERVAFSLNNSKPRRPEPLRLMSSIETLFIACGLYTVISLTVILVELFCVDESLFYRFIKVLCLTMWRYLRTFSKHIEYFIKRSILNRLCKISRILP